MMLKDGEIYFIDFGLGFKSQRIEDKASDLYLLKQALESTHFSIVGKAWQIILKVYQQNYPEKRVMETLKKIEKRRRYVKIDMV
jgi:Kae1-associated kinase Bud32